MACNCIETVDAKLASRNTRVTIPIMFGADQTVRPMIVVEQIETGRGKQKACGLFATFCPFCGTLLASVDGRPQAGDPAQTGAPLATSAVPAEERADAQPPSKDHS